MNAYWFVIFLKYSSKFCFGSFALKIITAKNWAYKVGYEFSLSMSFFWEVEALPFSSESYLAFKNLW